MKNTIKTMACLLLAESTSLTTVSAKPSGESPGTETLTQEQANNLMKNEGIGLIRNAGQVYDNMGQPCPDVFYKLEYYGVDIFVTKYGLTYSFNKWEEEPPSGIDKLDRPRTKHITDQVRTDWYLQNANINAQSFIEEEKTSEAYYNFYSGSLGDKATHLFKYKRLTVKNIYPGIDWVIKADVEKGLKYDFIVHPGGDPSLIKIQVKGAESLAVSKDNKSLVISNKLTTITDENLIAYQTINGLNTVTDCKFNLQENLITFDIPKYNKANDLIIDPAIILPWATYYGGVNEEVFKAIKVKVAASKFAAVGHNANGSFPVASLPSGTNNGSYDAVIAVFNLNGVLQWAGYIGSSQYDYANYVVIDASGRFIIVGQTGNFSFPPSVTLPYANAGGYYQTTGTSIEGWIARVNSTGTNIGWCTLLGGNDQDLLNSVDIDPTTNDIIVAGMSYSTNLPIQQQGTGFYQPTPWGGGTNQDIMLAKFGQNTVKKWCTYFGGNGQDYNPCITTDGSGFLYLTGLCGSGTGFPILSKPGAFNQATFGGSFVSVFAPSSTQSWCTYWGGYFATGIDVDPTTKDVYICGVAFTASGYTTKTLGGSSYFQNTYGGGDYDGYIASFAGGSWALKWSTLLGKTSKEYPRAITVSPQGGVIVVGAVEPNYPVTSSYPMPYVFASSGPYYDNTCNIISGVSSSTSQWEGFISYFDPNKFLQWSTFYGIDGAYEVFYDADIDGQYCFIDGLWQKDCIAPISTNHTVNPGGGAYYQANPGGTCIPGFYADWDGCVIKLFAADPGYFKIGNQDETESILINNDNQSISFSLNNSNKSKVIITDVLGRCVYHNSSVSSQTRINIANFQRGIYLLQITEGEKIAIKKFFKN